MEGKWLGRDAVSAVCAGDVGLLRKLFVSPHGVRSASATLVDEESQNGLLHIAAHEGKLKVVRFCVEVLRLDLDRLCVDRTALYIAARCNHVRVVQYLLSAGANPLLGPDGRSPLFVACREGAMDVVRFLAGTNLYQLDQPILGVTPLFEACWRGHVHIVKFLIRLDCDIEFTTERDAATPLFAASRGGHLPIVDLLLQHGCQVDRADSNGVTPFYVACHEGHIEVVKRLAAAGCDRLRKCNAGKTPLFTACQMGHLHIVRELLHLELSGLGGEDACIPDIKLDHPNSPSQRRRRWTQQQHQWQHEGGVRPHPEKVGSGDRSNNSSSSSGGGGSSRGSERVPNRDRQSFGMAQPVEVFVQPKAPLRANAHKAMSHYAEEPDLRGRTPLHAAAGGGHVDTVLLLLHSLHCTPDGLDGQGHTPLFLACERGHTEVVRVLAKAGCSLERHCGVSGATPLFIACWHGHAGVVGLLLSLGCSMERACNGGSTPFYIACQEGHLSVVRMLLEAGCDRHRPLRNGASPLFAASWKGHEHVVRYLGAQGCHLEQGLNGITPVFVACQEGHLGIVRYLISRGCDAECPDPHGFTPLWLACFRGDLRVVEALCAAGCDVERTCNEATPFYIACRYGHLHIVRFLARAGCDLTRERKGISPLEIACYYDHFAVAHELARLGVPGVTALAATFASKFNPNAQSRSCANFLSCYNTTNRPASAPPVELVMRVPVEVVTRGLGAVKQYERALRRAAVAFCMAKHPRLGAQSPARVLPPELVQRVCELLFDWQPAPDHRQGR